MASSPSPGAMATLAALAESSVLICGPSLFLLCLTGLLRGPVAGLREVLLDGSERLVRDRQRGFQVRLRYRGGDEPVVPRGQVDTGADRGTGEDPAQLVVTVSGEGQVRHRRRSGVVNLQSAASRLAQD